MFNPKLPPIEDRKCSEEGCETIVSGPPGVICDAHATAREEDYWAREIKMREMYARETIPAKFRWARAVAPDLETRVPNHQARQHAFAAVEARRPALLIGPSGVGKTSLAVAMLDLHLGLAAKTRDPARILRAGTSRFLKATRLQSDWWTSGMGHECTTVVEAHRADLLVLDDLGIEPFSSVVVRVLKDRADEQRPTIVTTSRRHSEPDSISRVYGEGVWRAITDNAAYIDLNGAAAQ